MRASQNNAVALSPQEQEMLFSFLRKEGPKIVKMIMDTLGPVAGDLAKTTFSTLSQQGSAVASNTVNTLLKIPFLPNEVRSLLQGLVTKAKTEAKKATAPSPYLNLMATKGIKAGLQPPVVKVQGSNTTQLLLLAGLAVSVALLLRKK